MRLVLTVIALPAAAAVAALVAGHTTWRRHTAQAVAGLTDTPSVRAHDAALDSVPPPAARYLRRALGRPDHRVRSAIATKQGEFFINGAWRPLSAKQHFTTDPPGFVWDARIEMAPLVPAFVRDAYVKGRGSMQASVYGVYPLVNLAGTPELNAGALQRFLGEAVWFPTALLPSASIRWSPRDDHSSIVTLADHGIEVSLAFEFDGNDDVMRISGDRFKETDGAYVKQKWLIQCFEHRERAGMRIPTSCEVSWIGRGGPEPYWRGRITAINYSLWP